jgi:hypothetical protein
LEAASIQASLPAPQPELQADNGLRDSVSPVGTVPADSAAMPTTGRFTALALAAAELSTDTDAEGFRLLLARIPAADRPYLLRAWAELSNDALAFALNEAGGDAYSASVADTTASLVASRPADVAAAFAAHPGIAQAQRNRAVELLAGMGQFTLAERLAATDADAAATYATARLKADPTLSPLTLIWRFQSDSAVRDAVVDATVLARQESPEQVQEFVADAIRSGVATPASLASAAVTMSPLEALEWLRSLPVSADLKSRPLVESFQTLIADGPEAGAEWLLQQPASVARDEMVLALCHRLEPRHASVAQAWADSISTPRLREEAAQFLSK